jgi:hypothetical protein
MPANAHKSDFALVVEPPTLMLRLRRAVHRLQHGADDTTIHVPASRRRSSVPACRCMQGEILQEQIKGVQSG